MDAKSPVSRIHGNCFPVYSDVAYPLPSPQMLLCSHVDFASAVTKVLQPELDEGLPSGHDSFLEYINGMLMDENFEDSSWQLIAHSVGGLVDAHGSTSGFVGDAASVNDHYERIYKEFHEIVDDSVSNPLALKSVESLNEASNGQLMVRDRESLLAEVNYNEFSPYLYLQAPKEDEFMNDSGHVVQAAHIAEVTSDMSQQMDNLVSRPGVQQLNGQMKDPPPSVQLHLATVKPETQDISLVQNADLPTELFAHLFDELSLRGYKEMALSFGGHASERGHNEQRPDEALENPVDLKALILSSGKALGNGNVRHAMDYLQQIQQENVSPHGSGLQRVVHYFSEALSVRLSGMGNMLYKAMSSTAQLPSPLKMVRAYKMMFNVCPYVKVAYLFANQYILKAASRVTRLHIIDYGILYGFQWPCLLYTLAHRDGGPPFVRITGIEFPANPVDKNPKATTEGTKHRLSEYARTYNVPFEYHAISSSKWEDLDALSLRISEGELLVINSFNRLGHIHDENLVHPSPRERLLKQMRSLNPSLLVMGSMNAAHSTPFFAPRFREAFYYYANMFDMIHTTTVNDSPEREMFERELMGRSILNVVACEGAERVELPETYKQWQARMTRVGFRQLSVIPSVLDMSKAIMKRYHKDFSLIQDSNKWLLVGWRGRSVQALSAWEPDRH